VIALWRRLGLGFWADGGPSWQADPVRSADFEDVGELVGRRARASVDVPRFIRNVAVPTTAFEPGPKWGGLPASITNSESHVSEKDFMSSILKVLADLLVILHPEY